MTVAEMQALADGLVPVVQDRMDRALEPVIRELQDLRKELDALKAAKTEHAASVLRESLK